MDMTTYEKAKEILQRACPESIFRSQGPDWKGEFPLSNSITEYFREFGPVDVEIPAYGICTCCHPCRIFGHFKLAIAIIRRLKSDSRSGMMIGW